MREEYTERGKFLPSQSWVFKISPGIKQFNMGKLILLLLYITSSFPLFSQVYLLVYCYFVFPDQQWLQKIALAITLNKKLEHQIPNENENEMAHVWVHTQNFST